MIRVRIMEAGDIPLGLSLCRCAGWNQLEEDWRRIIALTPQGVFVAVVDGVQCGTASVTCYGDQLAWIGMVLVHPDFRGRGVGSTLMQRCLQFLDASKVNCIKLDATEQGRSVYRKLGFEDEMPVTRFVLPKQSNRFNQTLPPIDERDWQAIGRLDTEIFGADRMPLLRRLAGDGISAVRKDWAGIQGYGFARRGFNASFLGPLIGANTDCIHSLAVSLLHELPQDRGVYWDLLLENADARDLAQSLGFQVERSLTRMSHGRLASATDITRTFGIAGFETG